MSSSSFSPTTSKPPVLTIKDYLDLLECIFQTNQDAPILQPLKKNFPSLLKSTLKDKDIQKKTILQLKSLPLHLKNFTLEEAILGEIIRDLNDGGKHLKALVTDLNNGDKENIFNSIVNKISSTSYSEEKIKAPPTLRTGVSPEERKLIANPISAPVDNTSALKIDPVDELYKAGAAFYKEKKYAEALPYFEGAITFAELTRRPPHQISALKRHQAYALNGVGGIFFKKEEYVEAIRYLTRATDIAIKIQVPLDELYKFERVRVLALNTLGTALETDGKYADALVCYERIRNIPPLARLPEPEDQVSAAEKNQARVLSKLRAARTGEEKPEEKPHHPKKTEDTSVTKVSVFQESPTAPSKKAQPDERNDASMEPSSTR
jgi:tetratricopeptide (TPR) repeat protein